MMRCFAILALVATQATADERFIPYIDWITDNSPLEYNGEPLPTIVQMPYAWLEVMYYGDQRVAEAEQDGRELAKVMALYDHRTDEMLFPDDIDPFEQEDVITHELVHYLQDINGTLDECPPNNEEQAYRLHWQWVQETGYEAEEPNWLYVLLLKMACMDMHPNIAP